MEELLKQAAVIRDEMVDEENSAQRIGTLFVDVIQRMQKIVSDEQVKVDSLKVIAKEDTVSIYFDVADDLGNVIHKKLSIPVVSKSKAGILTSLQLNELQETIARITPVLISETKFNELRESGKLDSRKFYYIYDEES